METVPRIHVEKLSATIEQQYKENKPIRRRIPQGREAVAIKFGLGLRQERVKSGARAGAHQRDKRRRRKRRSRESGTPEGKRKGGRGGQTERLDASKQVLLLCGRQAG